jgi:UDPglucose--hexose-1-phosphate uridylyltransferase
VFSGPHRRHNPLTDEWVLVSAHRTQRPWLGDELNVANDDRPAYDPACYLCPGNARAGGARNADYEHTFVFTNDFPALHPDTGTDRVEQGLLLAEGERGTCRVICFSPRHDLGLGGLGLAGVREVIDLSAEQSTELGRTYRWVQVFENRGAAMGASNPHPHGQIWAGSALPREAAREDASQLAHLTRTRRPLLLDYIAEESGGPRVVTENDEWLVVVPFWAAWPFETLVIPKRTAPRLADLSPVARDRLAAILIDLLARYDGLFDHPFPYSMGWHQAPFGGHGATGSVDANVDHWQLHGHFFPPLLRSASIRKFMVGYELLAEAQRDLTAEHAAKLLREVAVPPQPDEEAPTYRRTAQNDLELDGLRRPSPEEALRGSWS